MEFYEVNAPDPDLCSFMYPDPQTLLWVSAWKFA